MWVYVIHDAGEIVFHHVITRDNKSLKTELKTLDVDTDMTYQSMSGVERIDILCDVAAIIGAALRTKRHRCTDIDELELVSVMFAVAEKQGFTKTVAVVTDTIASIMLTKATRGVGYCHISQELAV